VEGTLTLSIYGPEMVTDLNKYATSVEEFFPQNVNNTVAICICSLALGFTMMNFSSQAGEI
jgi:hypothetical protein